LTANKAGLLALLLALPAAAQTPTGGPETLSDPQKLKRAEDHLERMRAVLNQVIKNLEEARDEKDVVKMNCVNEKLTQVKGLLKVSELAALELKEAAARRMSDAADHEYTKVSIARQRVEQLQAEAQQCVGSIVGTGDETIVVVEEPEDIRKELDIAQYGYVRPSVVYPTPASPVG
jgi:hypothetical protein